MTKIETLLKRGLYKKSFYDFYKDFWNTTDAHPYVDGKIVKYMCELFQFMCRKWVGYVKPKINLSQNDLKNYKIIDITNSNKDRLCLNIPPRHSKSKIFNVLGPTWLWTHYPIKAVSISHTFDLAKSMNEDRWSVVNSELYKTLYDINIIANTKDSIIDDRGGQLYSQNRGALTGYGGDVIINDDLTNAMTAYRDMTEMNNAWQYYRNTMPSRVNDVNKSVILNIQQRLGVNDITGHILKEKELRDRYIFITLPAIFNESTILVCPITGEIIKYEKGEGLWRERFGNYEGIKAEVGLRIFQTQYLQEPQSNENAVIEEKMINIKAKTEVPSIKDAEIIYASHDFPVKDKESSDYLGSILAYKIDNVLYIEDCLEKHMNFPSSINYAISLENIYPGIIQIIEDKANGSPILQQLGDRVEGLQSYNPGTLSKMMRLDNASMYMNTIVFVANNFDVLEQKWKVTDNIQNLINRLLSFPMVEHDDIVDAFSMLVNFIYLDKARCVYGKSFNNDNYIEEIGLKDLYTQTFVNKEGDTWKANKIAIQYGITTNLIIYDEIQFKSSINEGIKKLREFDPKNNVFIDTSVNGDLMGVTSEGACFERYNVLDFNESVINVNLYLSTKQIKLYKSCKKTVGDILNFKFSKNKNNESKYITEKDGFVANIRNSILYFGGLN